MLCVLRRRLSVAARRGPNRASLAELGITQGASLDGGFLVRSIRPLPEFDVTLVDLWHERTGAQLVHVDSSDTNNAFAVSFRTPAKESTGVAHILEHIVLCGSQRFPVRDPFFKMLKRSMNTFMNAMTGGDYTVYPFSTVVPSDYDNLLQVYLDACFFPLLRKTDFMQEGHRLEVVGEPAHLKRAGVVFNEMKGHLSSSSALFGVEVNARLFGEESVYGQVSGGDWKVIPELTHDRLVDFHRTQYHPSNALFVTYGDLPLPATLHTINQRVLSKFAFSASNAQRPLELIREPVLLPSASASAEVAHITLPQDSEADTGRKVLRAWTLPELDSTQVDRVFQASIVSELLLEGASAPVYAQLIESRIAPQYAPGCGLDASTFHPSFALGASGVHPDKVAEVDQAILKGLELAVRDGFPPERVESILHQMELGRRHKRADFGLTCIQAACSTWVHGGDVMRDALDFTGPIARFRAELERNPQLLQQIARELVLERFSSPTGVVRIVATPSADFSVQEPEVQVTSEEQVAAVRRDNAELARERELAEDLAVLPTLTVQRDVPRAYADPLPAVALDSQYQNQLQVVQAQKTNGVAYLRGKLAVDRPTPLLPLVCAMLGDVDAGQRTYKQLDQDLEMYGGALSVSPSFPVWLAADGANMQQQRPEVFFSLDCLAGNASKAYGDLLGDILTQSSFTRDVQRVDTLLQTRSEALKSGLSRSCPKYAHSRCMAAFGGEYAVQDAYAGFSQYQFVHKLAQREDKLAVAGELQHVFEHAIASRAPELSLCSDDSKVSSAVHQLIKRFPNQQTTTTNGAPSLFAPAASPRASYLALPVPVHYCHAVVRTAVQYGHEDDAALLVLSRLASYDYLHQHVREKGGAYGSGCSLDQSGFLAFSSFWDPHSAQTLQVFDSCLEWLCQADFTEKQVDEALLSVFASLDAPQHASNKGVGQFRHGLTQAMKDVQRDKLFDLVGQSGVGKLRTVARRHLAQVDSFLVGTQAQTGQQVKSSVCIAGKKDTSEEFAKRGFEVTVA